MDQLALKVFAAAFLVALMSPGAYGATGQHTTIEVVNNRTSERHYSYYIPGANGSSTTNCNTNATGTSYGSSTNVNGTTDCTTTSTPGRAASWGQSSIAQAHIFAIMQNGTHVTLWCQAGFRRCSTLQPATYDVEVKGDAVWVYGHKLDGKLEKIKYHYVGGW